MDDPESSPRRRANSFTALMERMSALGPKQRTALFTLIMSLYRRHGFHQDDPRTWSLSVDPRGDRAQAQPRAPTDPRTLPLPTLDWFEKTAEEKSQLKRDWGLRFDTPIKT